MKSCLQDNYMLLPFAININISTKPPQPPHHQHPPNPIRKILSYRHFGGRFSNIAWQDTVSQSPVSSKLAMVQSLEKSLQKLIWQNMARYPMDFIVFLGFCWPISHVFILGLISIALYFHLYILKNSWKVSH